MNIPLIIIAIIILIIIICIIVNHIYSDKTIEKNMHHYAYYNKEDSKIYYNIIEPFIRSYESVYMSDSLKNNIFQSIDDHLKLNKLNKKLNYPKSLRLIISGKESIGKTTLIESIASYFNLGLIHFPKNYYSEKMIHIFFQDINNEFNDNNIILFDNIDFNTIYKKNNQIYDLLGYLISKHNKNNIFIFTFNNLESILPEFNINFSINKHYHMEIHINHIMRMVGKYVENENKLIEIKNNFLKINHKLTPGIIIPYLLFNEDFQKSLDRFFKIIN
jgi:hypothetical protein